MILIIVLSCKKEKNDDIITASKKDTLIVIDESNNNLGLIKVIYFVTSLNGNLIASQSMEKNSINVIYISDSIKHVRFNVHKFTYLESSNSFSLESVLNTDKVYYNDNDPCKGTNPYNYMGDCNFKFNDISNDDLYSISFPMSGQEGYGISPYTSASLFTDNNYLFTFTKKGDHYFYKYYHDLMPGKTYQISLNTDSMKTDVEVDTISAPPNYKFDSFNSILACLNGDYECYYSAHGIFNKPIDNGTKLLVVSPPSHLYKYYHSVYNLVGVKNEEYSYFHLGNIPKNIPAFNFNLNIVDSSINNVSINTTGKFDFLLGEYLADYTTNVNNWKFYTDNSTKVVFPKLPEDVKKLVPFLSEETFTKGINSYFNFTLYDIEGVDSYEGFINTYDRYSNLKQYQIFQRISIGGKYNK